MRQQGKHRQQDGRNAGTVYQDKHPRRTANRQPLTQHRRTNPSQAGQQARQGHPGRTATVTSTIDRQPHTEPSRAEPSHRKTADQMRHRHENADRETGATLTQPSRADREPRNRPPPPQLLQDFRQTPPQLLALSR